MTQIVLLSLVMTLVVNGVLHAEPSIGADGRRVLVGSTAFDIVPAQSVSIENELYLLSSDKPDRWAKGTHLKGCLSKVTALPDCLVPGSVVVKLPDGTVLERNKDYLLDERWAALARVDSGRIAKDTQVLISYRVGQMRLDQIQLDPHGKPALVQGEPRKTSPQPPALLPGHTAFANIFMPYHARTVEDWQLFRIGRPFPEPDKAEMQRRASFIPKTLAKLRAGREVRIVTWGDSVTAGGDASPGRAFPELFTSRLQARFPSATIVLTNAGIGATNTSQRLPHLPDQVLLHRPDLVTIEFINDMGFPDAVMRRNYVQAFSQIRASGAEVILITPHFAMPEMMGRAHERGPETRPNVQLLRILANENTVALADVSKRWEHLESEGLPYITLLDNGINHPNDQGHELFVKELLTFFPSP